MWRKGDPANFRCFVKYKTSIQNGWIGRTIDTTTSSALSKLLDALDLQDRRDYFTMRFTQVITSGLALLSSSVVLGHPGHDIEKEIAERREYLNSVKQTNLAHCAEKLRARGIERRNVARRQALVENARTNSM